MAEQKRQTSSGGAFPFFLGMIVMLVIGWAWFPKVLFSEKLQPIRFSHAMHVEDGGMECEDCHYLRDDGSYAGIPLTEACAECHADVMGEDPEEEKFVNEYVNNEKEVEWLVYQYQPDNVFFSHAAHKDTKCTTCHPDIGGMDAPPIYYENKLTGYSKQTMKMWRCEECHAENGGDNPCYKCHR